MVALPPSEQKDRKNVLALRQKAHKIITSLPTTTTIIYTDGGCLSSPGASGAGALLILPPNDLGQNKVSAAAVPIADGTNNLAELVATELGLDLLSSSCPRDEVVNVAIVSDSKYTIDQLGKHPTQGHRRYGLLITRIRAKLHELDQAGVGLSLIWTPGHAGVPGNECADILATEAAHWSVRNPAQCWRHPDPIHRNIMYFDEHHCQYLKHFKSYLAKLDYWQQRDYFPP
jgi:ribonuclease HI